MKCYEIKYGVKIVEHCSHCYKYYDYENNMCKKIQKHVEESYRYTKNFYPDFCNLKDVIVLKDDELKHYKCFRDKNGVFKYVYSCFRCPLSYGGSDGVRYCLGLPTSLGLSHYKVIDKRFESDCEEFPDFCQIKTFTCLKCPQNNECKRYIKGVIE